MMKKSTKWKVFFILLGLCLISIICVFPYILSVQGELLKQIELPIEILFAAQFIQSSILFSILILLGLFFTQKINFQLPLIEAIVEKDNYKKILNDILGKSILIGAITAIIIYLLDPIFTAKGAGITTHVSLAPIWQKLLASVYGGVTEEILLRLFLMTFFVWLSMRLFKRNAPTNLSIIISIVFAAVIFGLGHLPITASITKIDTLVVTRAIVLNGIGGIIFGWLFWKKGLESAMIAHFTADIFLLTLLPLLFG